MLHSVKRAFFKVTSVKRAGAAIMALSLTFGSLALQAADMDWPAEPPAEAPASLRVFFRVPAHIQLYAHQLEAQ